MKADWILLFNYVFDLCPEKTIDTNKFLTLQKTM